MLFKVRVFIFRMLPLLSLGLVISFMMLPFFAKPMELATEDYGRHLINGREVLSGNFSVLFANTYSYESSDHTFINHHWLFGVIVYLADKVIGIVRIQMLYFAMVVIAGVVTLRSYFSQQNHIGMWLAAIPLSFLLASRATVRPEGFGLLFLSIFLALLHAASVKKKITRKTIVMLVLLQILWVNIHISFVFGIIVTFAYGVFQSKTTCIEHLKLVLLLFLASCINPNGIFGAIAPFTIFQDYGYRVVENQNLFFLASRISNPFIGVYWGYTLLVVGLAMFWWKKISVQSRILAILGVALGWSALRNLPLTGLLCIPLLAEGFALVNATSLLTKKYEHYVNEETKILGVILLYVLMMFGVYTGQFIANRSTLVWSFGYGKNQFAAVDFLTSSHLRGNIFNNYDIGSYLIGSLYPSHKVFVDNRPEAYGKAFFEKLYIPLQTDEDVWKTFVQEKDIQVIVFGYTDITSWAREFMVARLSDPDWIPVYLDERAIIWVKNVPEYKEITEKHRISEEYLKRFCLDLGLDCSADLR